MPAPQWPKPIWVCPECGAQRTLTPVERCWKHEPAVDYERVEVVPLSVARELRDALDALLDLWEPVDLTVTAIDKRKLAARQAVERFDEATTGQQKGSL